MNRPSRVYVFLLVAAASATACNDSALDLTVDSGADALEVPDAGSAADASPPSLPAELVGVWQRTSNGNVLDQFMFGADGSFSFDETNGPDHILGTFGATDSRVFADATTQDDTAITYMFTYYVNATHLAFAAGLPVGAHDGVVGTWVFDLRIDTLSEAGGTVISSFGARTELVLRIDGTGTSTGQSYAGGAPMVREGTWEQADEINDEPAGPNGYIFRSGAVGNTFTLIDGAALGSLDFAKAP